MNTQDLIQGLSRYCAAHPDEILRIAKNAAFFRFGVPLAALRYLITQLNGKKAPRDVQIEAVPPGIRIGATLELMGTQVRASLLAFIEGVRLSSSELRFELRLEDVALDLVGDSDTAVATLLKSKALDLSKPGNLVAYMPKRPQFLVAAEGNRVVLDLMKHPKVAGNPTLQRWIAMVTPLVTLSGVETDWERLDLVCTPLEQGLLSAVNAIKVGIQGPRSR